MRSRRAVVLFLGILCLAPSGAASQVLTAADSLAVFDANGTRVGAVIGVNFLENPQVGLS